MPLILFKYVEKLFYLSIEASFQIRKLKTVDVFEGEKEKKKEKETSYLGQKEIEKARARLARESVKTTILY